MTEKVVFVVALYPVFEVELRRGLCKEADEMGVFSVFPGKIAVRARIYFLGIEMINSGFERCDRSCVRCRVACQ